MEPTATKATFQKYAAYKDSGSDWSGKIPVKWNALPIRAVFEERNEKNDGPKTNFILSVTKDRGVIPYDEKGQIGNNKSEDIERYKVVYPNDFVINKMNVIIGSLGMSKYYGAFSQVYLVYKPKSSEINIEYYSYIFSNPSFFKSLIRFCTGIMELRESLNKNDFKKIVLPFPDFKAQSKIVKFLDEKTAKIDRAIAQKEQLIALLKERKQIVIQNAVTKGLDPDVEMKDSGVEWIGQIPAHWDVKRLKYVLKTPLKYGANESGIEYSPDLPRYVRITDFSMDGKLSEDKKLSLSWEEGKNYLLEDGDILFARSGATVGKSYQFRKSMSVENHYSFAGYLIKASPNEEVVLSDFLKYFTMSGSFENWKSLIFNKATIENIGADKYSELCVIAPPIFEQTSIIDYIKRQSAKIDQAISLQQTQIDKLKEYKTTLIDSAVTGKIKVT